MRVDANQIAPMNAAPIRYGIQPAAGMNSAHIDHIIS